MNAEATTTTTTTFDDLVHDHLPLVEAIAARVYRRVGGSVELTELISFGAEGLLQAARRFDPSGSASFKTFAHYRIRGAIYDGLARHGSMGRKAYRRYRDEWNACSLTALPQHGTVETDPIEDMEPTDERLFKSQMFELLEKAIAELPERKRKLIRARYFEGSTLEGAGAELNVSKSWASRMHASALMELRSHLSAVEGDWH